MSQPIRASQPRCRTCGKGSVWPGLCSTCATGLPRRLYRPEEGLRELADTGGRLLTRGAGGHPAGATGEREVQGGWQPDQSVAQGAHGQYGPEEEVGTPERAAAVRPGAAH